MRLALISDLHANYAALTQLEDVLCEADQVVCLGDFVGYHCQVNEVLDFIRGLQPLAVLGNHDRFLLADCPADANEAVRFGIDHADRVIDPNHRAYLAALPWCWGGNLDGRSFFFVHGTPWRPLDDYLYADHPMREQLEGFDYDVIAVGQTHRVAAWTESRPWVLNPGSVGQSRDVEARACVMILDTETLRLECIQRPYDTTPVVELAVRNGAGSWVLKHMEPRQAGA